MDLSRFSRPLKNSWERPHSDISQLSQYLGMNLIGPHKLICIQIDQQIPHKFGADWESVIATVTVLQLRAPRGPGPIISVKHKGKETLNVSA